MRFVFYWSCYFYLSFITFPVWKMNNLICVQKPLTVLCFDTSVFVLCFIFPCLYCWCCYCWRLNTKPMPSEVIVTKGARKLIFDLKVILGCKICWWRCVLVMGNTETNPCLLQFKKHTSKVQCVGCSGIYFVFPTHSHSNLSMSTYDM